MGVREPSPQAIAQSILQQTGQGSTSFRLPEPRPWPSNDPTPRRQSAEKEGPGKHPPPELDVT